MITFAEVEKLGRIHTVEPIVLSVYLDVPRTPAEWQVLLVHDAPGTAASLARGVADQQVDQPPPFPAGDKGPHSQDVRR